MKYSIIIFLAVALMACSNSGNTEQKADASTSQDSLISEAAPAPTKVEKAKVYTELPDFTKYTDTKEKKNAFFSFLRPMVEEEDQRITNDRIKLLGVFDAYQKNGVIMSTDTAWLADQAKTMRMKFFDISSKKDQEELLRRVDVVPPSLFLAQAANESSWGTSRFAKQANNLFGQWCFTPGCGIVPSQRAAGETHEVQKFATVNDAVNSYVRNINSHNAYKELRVLREEIRMRGEKPDGITLAGGLLKYSTRGEEYVKEIRSMIKFNKLEEENQ